MAVRLLFAGIKVDDEKKSIFCDLDDAKEGIINVAKTYLSIGYKLYPYKQGKIADSKVGDKRKREYWLELCNSEEERETFESICKGSMNVDGKHGFFVAKSWLQRKHCLEACQTDEQREMFLKICDGEEKIKGKSGLSVAYKWLKSQIDEQMEKEEVKSASKSRAKKTTETTSEEA